MDRLKSTKSKAMCLNVEIGEPSSREKSDDLPEWASNMHHELFESWQKLFFYANYVWTINDIHDCTYRYYLIFVYNNVSIYSLYNLLFTNITIILVHYKLKCIYIFLTHCHHITITCNTCVEVQCIRMHKCVQHF